MNNVGMDGRMDDSVGKNDKKEKKQANKQNVLCEVTAFCNRVMRYVVSVHKAKHKGVRKYSHVSYIIYNVLT
jgi:hypothetical protein